MALLMFCFSIVLSRSFGYINTYRLLQVNMRSAYDHGRDNKMASIYLPDYKLKAEYWVNEVNADDAFTETGIWLYVATDQVRIINTETNAVVELPLKTSSCLLKAITVCWLF